MQWHRRKVLHRKKKIKVSSPDIPCPTFANEISFQAANANCCCCRRHTMTMSQAKLVPLGARPIHCTWGMRMRHIKLTWLWRKWSH